VKFYFWTAMVLLVGAGLAPAQQFEVIQELRSADEVGYREAAYAVLVSSGELPDSARPDAALNDRLRRLLGWEERPTDGPVSVAEFSFLVMEGFDIPGGLLYRIAPGPRYAIRELRFRRIVLERLNGPSPIRGPEALRILGKAVEWQRQREEDAP
jgi:hypothetical protein